MYDNLLKFITIGDKSFFVLEEINFITFPPNMARVPCSFSAQKDFLLRVDARAAELGMKRSEYIVHALRRELLSAGSGMTVVATHSGIAQAGTGNKAAQTNYFTNQDNESSTRQRKPRNPPKRERKSSSSA